MNRSGWRINNVPKEQCRLCQHWPNIWTTVSTLGQLWTITTCCLGQFEASEQYRKVLGHISKSATSIKWLQYDLKFLWNEYDQLWYKFVKMINTWWCPLMLCEHDNFQCICPYWQIWISFWISKTNNDLAELCSLRTFVMCHYNKFVQGNIDTYQHWLYLQMIITYANWQFQNESNMRVIEWRYRNPYASSYPANCTQIYFKYISVHSEEIVSRHRKVWDRRKTHCSLQRGLCT